MKKVLFVCLGNICRSPAADGYLNHLIIKHELKNKVMCDSAGTSAYHTGEPADARMRESSLERGYPLNSISRAFNPVTDFKEFDYIIAMDNKNWKDLNSAASTDAQRDKIFKMVDFCTVHDVGGVPDPYYGAADGFELVLDIVEDACHGLLNSWGLLQPSA